MTTMADEDAPKKMSLKERIAAFEKGGSGPAAAAPSGSAPPAPRPKPGTLGQWKPKTTEGTPAAAASAAPVTAPKRGGMSASDAQESITKTGGLQARMAALQGAGAFGQPQTSSAPPLPSHEGKPRVWKTAVEHPPPKHDEHLDEHTPAAADADTADEEIPKQEEAAPIEQVKADEDNDDEAAEAERERRAAIAARMARLGGAKVSHRRDSMP